MFCEKCGKQFEGQGTLCPECAASAPQSGTLPLSPVFEDTSVTQPAPQQEMPGDAEAPFVLGEPEKPAKKKRIGLIAGISAAVIALAAGAYFLFFHGDSGNASAPVGTTPEAPVVQAPVPLQRDSLVDSLTDRYDAVKTASIPQASTAEMRIEIGDALYDMLEGSQELSGDLRWINDIQIVCDYDQYDGTLRENTVFSLHGTEIASYDVITSAEDSSVYYGLPELNNRYLRIENPYIASTFNTGNDVELLLQNLPPEEVVNRLLKRYIDLAAEEIAASEPTEETVELDGVSEKQYVTTVTITEAELMGILKTMLSQAQTDEDVKTVLDCYTAYLRASLGEDTMEHFEEEDLDTYTLFKDSIPDLMAQLDEYISNAQEGNYLQIKVYSNARGLITGLSGTVYSVDEEPVSIQFQSVTVQDVTHILCTTETFRLSGQIQKDEDTANFTISTDTGDGVWEESCTLELRVVENDKVVIKVIPGASMLESLLEGMPISAMSSALAGSVSATVTIYNVTESTITYSIELAMSSNSLVKVTVDMQFRDPEAIDLPTNAITYNAMEDEKGLVTWLQETSIDTLLGNLRSVGAPQEQLDLLQQHFDEIKGEYEDLLSGTDATDEVKPA